MLNLIFVTYFYYICYIKKLKQNNYENSYSTYFRNNRNAYRKLFSTGVISYSLFFNNLL